MQLIIKENYDQVSQFVADYIVRKIVQFKPTVDKPFVLGLPTGSTPLGVYKCLIEKYKHGELSFEHVVTFNMDEYVGLPPEHEQSYHYFMHSNFFDHIDIPPKNIHIPDGMATDVEAEGENYEKLIAQYGGIRLFLGGVGVNGHVAFNEPGISVFSKTGYRELSYETRDSNSRFFGSIDEVPTGAMSIGILTLLDAKEVIIMATGKNKANAVYHAIECDVNQMWPVSYLQMHKNAMVVCDDDATDELKVKTVKYFKGLQKDSHNN